MIKNEHLKMHPPLKKEKKSLEFFDVAKVNYFRKKFKHIRSQREIKSIIKIIKHNKKQLLIILFENEIQLKLPNLFRSHMFVSILTVCYKQNSISF